MAQPQIDNRIAELSIGSTFDDYVDLLNIVYTVKEKNSREEELLNILTKLRFGPNCLLTYHFSKSRRAIMSMYLFAKSVAYMCDKNFDLLIEKLKATRNYEVLQLLRINIADLDEEQNTDRIGETDSAKPAAVSRIRKIDHFLDWVSEWCDEMPCYDRYSTIEEVTTIVHAVANTRKSCHKYELLRKLRLRSMHGVSYLFYMCYGEQLLKLKLGTVFDMLVEFVNDGYCGLYMDQNLLSTLLLRQRQRIQTLGISRESKDCVKQKKKNVARSDSVRKNQCYRDPHQNETSMNPAISMQVPATCDDIKTPARQWPATTNCNVSIAENRNPAQSDAIRKNHYYKDAHRNEISMKQEIGIQGSATYDAIETSVAQTPMTDNNVLTEIHMNAPKKVKKSNKKCDFMETTKKRPIKRKIDFSTDVTDIIDCQPKKMNKE